MATVATAESPALRRCLLSKEFQVSGFKFQVSSFKFQVSGGPEGLVSGFKFQVSSFRFFSPVIGLVLSEAMNLAMDLLRLRQSL